MEIFDLEIFAMVATEGNITKASELMHLSQPTVSRRIRELEEELGRRLLNRTNKSVSLTEEGRQFLEASSDILTIYQKVVHQEKNQQSLKGDIYIGSGEIAAFSQLAECIRNFHSMQPGIIFHILSGNAEEIREDVESGVLDLGLITRSVDIESCGTLEFPQKARWGILIREDHPLAHRKRIRAEDLSGEPLILPENKVYHRELTDWFADHLQIAATYTLAHNAVQLVKAGLGSMLCFDDPSLVSEGLTFITLVPYRDATPLLIWRKRSVQSDAVSAFLQYVLENMTIVP